MRYLICLTALLLSLSGCINTVEIELPPPPKEIKVEGYLQPGLPPSIRLSELPALNVDLRTVPPIAGAKVWIRQGAWYDSLTYAIGTGVYESPRSVPDTSEAPFSLEILLENGTWLSANTAIMDLVFPDSIRFVRGTNGLYAAVVYFRPEDQQNIHYYRCYAGTTFAVDKDVFNTLSYDGTTVPYMTDFIFASGELLTVNLLHITKEYHDFYKSFVNSGGAGGQGIFVEPGLLRSNIQGGIGIFTAFRSSWTDVFVP